MIDTHCHLTFDGLRQRVDKLIVDAAAAGVDRMICVGATPEDARQALNLADRFAGVYATAGVHPHYADQPSDMATLASLIGHPKLVALGEMGLDWHYPEPSPEAQLARFEQQLQLLLQTPTLPGVIHSREATDDTIATIRASGVGGDRFVFHCFTGDRIEIDQILQIGAMVSFTGIVTFRSAAEVAAASDRVPLDHLMVETDAPYLTPEPHRKVRPNEPKYVVHVAEFLARRRGLLLEEFVGAVDANAQRFFRLPPT